MDIECFYVKSTAFLCYPGGLPCQRSEKRCGTHTRLRMLSYAILLLPNIH